MLLTRLVTTSADVGATRSRLAKRRFLADVHPGGGGRGAGRRRADRHLPVRHPAATAYRRRLGIDVRLAGTGRNARA